MLVLLLSGVTAGLVYLQIRHQRALLDLQGKIASLLFGLINGIAKLRVAGAEARAYARWAERFAEQRRRTLAAQRAANAQTAFNAVYGVLTSLVLFAVVGFASTETMPTGEFLAFSAAFGQFLAAALSLVSAFSSVLAMVPVYERLSPILETVPEVDESKAEPGDLAGEIEFSHVSFRYQDDGPLILDDVSFRAAPGEFIALVGPSGAGKSTCLRLILGFEKPTSGSIYFDGQDLAGLAAQSVRRQIGVVLQTGRPMAGSIFSNITGNSNLGIDDAWEAARMAGLEEDIKAMPMGMHTVISEGAETFSGGQKQRILIARAIVNRPRIILFDEATSALDNRTQEMVSRSLERLKATRIVIAHRLSTIQNADRIYVVRRRPGGGGGELPGAPPPAAAPSPASPSGRSPDSKGACMRKVLFLFGQLNDDDVEWMLTAGAKRFVPAGGVLIQQGVPVDALFILLEGKLAVWLKGKRRGTGARPPERRRDRGRDVLRRRPAPLRHRQGPGRLDRLRPLEGHPHRKLAADPGFAARFYRALAIYLSTTVRERHRDLAPGGGLEGDADEEDEADELDPNVLDGVYLAGERFDRMVKRVK